MNLSSPSQSVPVSSPSGSRRTEPLASEASESVPGARRIDPRKRRSRVTWVWNVRLLVITFATLVVVSPTVWLWHRYQVRNNSVALLERSQQLEGEQEWGKAASYLNRYLSLVPQDDAARIHLAEVFDKTAHNEARKTRASELYARALALAPDRIDLRARLGVLLLDLEHFADAESEGRAILSRSAADPVGLRVLAMALAGQARTGKTSWETAAEACRNAFDADPKDIELAQTLARIYRKELREPAEAHRKAAADAVMNRLVESTDKSVPALLARYHYRRDLGIPGSDADLDVALEKGPGELDVILAAAQREGARNDRAKAMELYRQALTAAPRDRRGYIGLGRLVSAEGKFDELVELLSDGLKQVGRDDVPLNFELAAALTSAGKLEESQEQLEVLTSLVSVISPRLTTAERLQLSTGVDLLRANLLIAKKDFRGAVVLLQRAITSQPMGAASEQGVQQHIQACVLLGSCHQALERADLAAAAFEKAAQLQPASPRHWLASGQAQESIGRFDLALRCYQQAARHDRTPASWLGVARLRFREQMRVSKQNRNWNLVEKALAEARKVSPDSSEVNLLLANLAALQGKPEQAIEALAQLEKTGELETSLARRLAMAYEELDRKADADRVAANHRKRHPESADAILLGVQLLHRRKQFDVAGRLLEASLETLPESERPRVLFNLAQNDLARGKQALARKRFAQLGAEKFGPLSLVEEVAAQAFSICEPAEMKPWEDRLREMEGPDGCLWRCLTGRRMVREIKTTADPRLAEAIQLQSEIQSIRPSWADGYLLKAELAEKRDRPEEAVEAYQQAITLGSRQTTAFQRLVALLLRKGRLAEANQYLARLGDGFRPAPVMAIEAFLHEGEVERAIEIAKEYADKNPKNMEAKVWLGQTQMLAGKNDEAEASLNEAVKMSPDEMVPWLAMLQFSVQRKDHEATRKMLDDLKSREKVPVKQRSFVLAQGYELIGDLSTAGEQYREAVKHSPDEVAVFERYSSFFVGRDAREAEKALRRVLELDPNAKAARRTLAAILASSGRDSDWQEASQLLSDGGADESAMAESDLRTKALLLAHKGTPEYRREALGIMERLVSSERDDVPPQDRLLLAKLYEATGKPRKAREQLNILNSAATPEGDHVAALVEHLLRQKQYGEVPALLKRLKEITPKSQLHTLLSARWLKSQGQADESEAMLETMLSERMKTLDNDKAKVEVLKDVADLYRTIDLPAAAERTFRKLVAVNPTEFKPLARFLIDQNRAHEAVVLSLQVGRDNPSADTAASMCHILARCQLTADDWQKADEIVAAATKDNSKHVRLLLAVATLSHLRHRQDESVRMYEQVLEIDPRHVQALNNLANLLAEIPGREADALKEIQKAITIQGHDTELLDTLGIVLLRRGEDQQAMATFEEAVQGESVDPRHRLHLAMVYDRLGKTEDAKKTLEIALAERVLRTPLTPMERTTLRDMQERLAAKTP